MTVELLAGDMSRDNVGVAEVPGSEARPIRAAPLASQVEAILERRVRSGEFAVGQQLPTEHELSGQLGVSRATVRMALGSLTRQGLVVSRHGVGSFVSAAAQIAHSLTDAIDLNELIARGGSVPGVLFDGAEQSPADDDVAEALGVDPGSLVHRCAKRFTADGIPVIYVVTSIPVEVLGESLAREAVGAPQITEPLFSFLENRCGLVTEYQLTSLESCLGDVVDHPACPLDGTTAVLQMDETGFTVDHRPIWFSRNWYPPGPMRFQLARQRPIHAR
jgi:GntR family transcriptional regulator